MTDKQTATNTVLPIAKALVPEDTPEPEKSDLIVAIGSLFARELLLVRKDREGDE